MTTAYADFLARKTRAHNGNGPVDVGDIHPSLHDWQAAVVRWAVRKGRCALFEDCGLGKTRQQLEWARLVTDRPALILAPLSVARQTVREAEAIDIDARYVRHGDDVTGPGIWITNYEMADRFDPSMFGAVVIDESSLLKNVDGRTRQRLTAQFGDTPYRLACTATPAPNDVSELTNHAEFLGIMSRVDMLASYFVHDDNGWRVKGHAITPMFKWMATWAMALRKPSDIGYADTGYDLPALRIHSETVQADLDAAEGQLFASLGGVAGRAKVRKQSMTARVERAVELANNHDDQWIVWCGLNDEAALAAQRIKGAVDVAGSWKPEQKAEALEAFQDGDIRVLVSKPSICGFGMNFQNAHHMVFVGLGDSYESYYQAIRRCWRFGQTNPVDVHVVVSALEQEIVENVRRKEQEAARTTQSLIRHMTLEEAA
jgi:superfamily II DNA or RNA helicase